MIAIGELERIGEEAVMKIKTDFEGTECGFLG
jgi:hypothetical protein